MATDWYYPASYTAVGVDWNQTTNTGTAAGLSPIVYRWDENNTANTGGTFDEVLYLPDGTWGEWTGLTWGSGSGTRQVDTFAERLYPRKHSSYTVTLTLKLRNYGSYKNGFKSLGYVQHDFNITISALASHTWSYDANGGSGAPGNQTKWYSEHGYLSTTTPSRTGYTFTGWLYNGTVYQPGQECTVDANITFVAQWSEWTYTVSYDANGGSGAPAAQTKYYSSGLALSSTRPTRALYNFLGWATWSSASSVQYQPGDTYWANEATTLYAVWQLAYQQPTVYDVNVYRCDANGNATDEGTYAHVSFNWYTFNSDYPATSVSASVNGTSVGGATGSTSGSYTNLFGGLDLETAYTVTMTVADKQSNTTRTATVQPISFIMDFSPSGGVGVGQIASGAAGSLGVSGDLTVGGTTYLNGVGVFAHGTRGSTIWSTGSPTWWRLGTWSGTNDSAMLYIELFTGNANNGRAQQNTKIDIFVKDGWQASESATESFGATMTVSGGTEVAELPQLQVRATAHNSCDIWVYLPWEYPSGGFRVFSSGGWWQTSVTNGTPSGGTLQDVAVFNETREPYPVGAVYMSFDSTSPASLFGGSWTQLWGVLRAAGDTGTGGTDSDNLDSSASQIYRSSAEAKNYGLTYNGNGFSNRAIVTNSSTFSRLPYYQNLYAWRRTE